MTDAGWASTKPTEAGWYWFRDLSRPYEDEREPYVVKVRQYAQHLAVGNCRLEGAPYGRGEFLGPLSPDDRQQGRVDGIKEALDAVRDMRDAERMITPNKRTIDQAHHSLMVIVQIGKALAHADAIAQQAAQDEKGEA